MELLKIQLPCQLGANTLHGWSKALQKVVYALNQCLIYVAVSLIGFMVPGIKTLGMVPFIITPSNPLENFLLLFPMTLFSAKGLSLKGRNAFTRKKK